ncbi:MAG: hypothetical protein ABI867_35870 [Kofleriaceae bacterium]
MYRAVVLAVLAAGCGGRCKEVAHARTALRERPAATARGADIRVSIPFEHANGLIASLLNEQPLTVPLASPDLGPINVTVPGFTATAREVHLQPGTPGKVRVDMRVEIRDADAEVATLKLVAEVEPELVRKDGAAELQIGFGAKNLLALMPVLGPEAQRELGRAVARWLPAKLRDRLPGPVVDTAANRLGSYLTGVAYKQLQKSLLQRTGEITRIKVRLPDVPIAKVEIRSTEQQLYVEITTDLPVRRGLAPADTSTTTDVGVAISGSAVAELANWAIDQGHAPQWYDRAIRPRTDGAYRPRFDYIAEDRAHPFKVYLFQERGGCAYFRVGVQAAIAMRGSKLEATALDRQLEASVANPAVEAAAWVKYFMIGSIDRSKQVAAQTQLTAGTRTLATQLVGASITGDELRFALRFTAGDASPAPPSARGTAPGRQHRAIASAPPPACSRCRAR